MKKIKSFVAATCFFVMVPCTAFPLTIEGTFIGGQEAGVSFGGGNMQDIFNAAAATWESVISDPFTLRIDYGWGGSTLGGNHWLLDQGGTPNRESYGLITVNPQTYNDGTLALLYLDPTPRVNDEFTTYFETTVDLGAGEVNSSRVYGGTTLGAVKDFYGGGWIDLESVFIHEIGHALGLSVAGTTFQAVRQSGHIDIDGNEIPLSANYSGYTSHLDVPGVVMNSLTPYERILPSAVDILTVAALDGFTGYDIYKQPVQENIAPVPEPSSIFLMAVGLAGVVSFTRRIRKKQSR